MVVCTFAFRSRKNECRPARGAGDLAGVPKAPAQFTKALSVELRAGQIGRQVRLRRVWRPGGKLLLEKLRAELHLSPGGGCNSRDVCAGKGRRESVFCFFRRKSTMGY
jgi:hypothetical protein